MAGLRIIIQPVSGGATFAAGQDSCQWGDGKWATSPHGQREFLITDSEGGGFTADAVALIIQGTCVAYQGQQDITNITNAVAAIAT